MSKSCLTGAALSTEDIRAIVGRSSTLAERLAGEVIATGQDRPRAEARLKHWKDLAAGGDEAVFRRVLGTMGHGGISDEKLLSLLGGVLPAPDQDLPRWAATLQEIVPAISTAFAGGGGDRCAVPASAHRSIPFAKLYAPIVAFARKQVGTAADRLRDPAWKGLESYLFGRLSAVCSLALQPRFLAYKAVRRAGANLTRFEKNPRPGAERGAGSFFDAFVNEQGRQGLRGFFLDHPTAARLSALVVLFWIDFVAELLVRLDKDAEEISARFTAGRPLGRIVRGKAGLSDPHRGGRSVIVLHFETGLRLVYKARPMQIDAAFSDLLSWLNAQGHTPPLPQLQTLTREDYGWENFIEHSHCRSLREAKHFFQRAGALICVVHALRGIDFHRENMVATAEGPVLVDLEALCHPAFGDPIVLENRTGGRWEYDSSVFRTGMLPIPARRPDGGRFSNLSALSGSILQRSPATDLRWKSINSDEMEAALGSHRLVCRTHRARLHGKLLSLRNHGEEVVAGYRRMARRFRSDDFRARVASLQGMETRLIKRHTSLYALMIRRSLQPRFLLDGVDRSLEFQALPSTAGDDEYRQAELAALEVLDVPAFFRRTRTETTAGSDPLGPGGKLPSQVAAIRAATTRQRHAARRGR